MSPEAQRLAIHRAVGKQLFVLHKPINDPFGYYRENAHGYTNSLAEAWKVTEEVARKHIGGRPTDNDRVVMEPAPIPDYLNDLNAMHEAEIVLENEIATADQYWTALAELTMADDEELGTTTRYRYIGSATAAQRAEAFLRTLNLWRRE